jgi:hypothetical protein
LRAKTLVFQSNFAHLARIHEGIFHSLVFGQLAVDLFDLPKVKYVDVRPQTETKATEAAALMGKLIEWLVTKAGSYLGCSVCAIITCFLKFSTIFASSRTSVGFFANVIVSILSCSLSNA